MRILCGDFFGWKISSNWIGCLGRLPQCKRWAMDVQGAAGGQFVPRHGHGQPIDMELMAELGYLPWPVFETMSLRGVFWEPAE